MFSVFPACWQTDLISKNVFHFSLSLSLSHTHTYTHTDGSHIDKILKENTKNKRKNIHKEKYDKYTYFKIKPTIMIMKTELRFSFNYEVFENLPRNKL